MTNQKESNAYEIWWDDENSDIMESKKEVDNEDVFKTYAQAKTKLNKIFRSRIKCYREALTRLKESKPF